MTSCHMLSVHKYENQNSLGQHWCEFKAILTRSDNLILCQLKFVGKSDVAIWVRYVLNGFERQNGLLTVAVSIPFCQLSVMMRGAS